jgi:putative flippase GtrA
MPAFLRFVLLSGGGWLLDVALLLALSRILTMPLGIANFLSSSIASLTVFFFSRHTVFRAASGGLMQRALVYLAYQAAGILLASMAVNALAAWAAFHMTAWGWTPTPAWAAFSGKVLITPPQLVANFFISRFLIQTKLRSYER